MLDQVWALLDTWEKDGIESALMSQTDLPTPDQLAPALEALPASQRRDVLSRLADFAAAIEAYQLELNKSMAVTDAEIRKLSSARNATLAYSTRSKD